MKLTFSPLQYIDQRTFFHWQSEWLLRPRTDLSENVDEDDDGGSGGGQAKQINAFLEVNSFSLRTAANFVFQSVKQTTYGSSPSYNIPPARCWCIVVFMPCVI